MSKADLEKLTAQFPGAIIASHSRHGDDTAVIRIADFPAVMAWLKGEAGFDFLVDVTAVDYLGRDLRFEVVYHLRSMQTGSRLRITLQVGQIEDGPAPEVPSVVALWPSANWAEREVYDMYGIKFADHPDLRRILMYEEFIGHPLRKDYPKEKRQPLIRRDYSIT
jgi:NADH-quinone oxidoreductase subunit C